MAYTSPPPAAEPPLKGKPSVGCSSQLSKTVRQHFRIQPSPPRHADAIGAGRAQHGHRGNIQGHGWRLRRSGHAEFSLPRGTQAPIMAAFQFHPTDFHVTDRFFVSFLTQERNVPLVSSSPVPSSFTPSRSSRPRTCRACAPWSARSARPRRPRWSARSGWGQNPSPWP